MSFGVVAILSAATAVVSIGNAVLVGVIFGATRQVEIYFAAVAIYEVFQRLFQAGHVSEAFTPLYHEARNSGRGDGDAFAFASSVINWLVAIAVLAVAAALALSEWLVPIVTHGFDVIDTQQSVDMFRWVMPVLVVQLIQAVLSAVLAAEMRYKATEVVRLGGALTSVVVLTIAQRSVGAWSLVWALWASHLVSLVLLVRCARASGYRHVLCWTSSRGYLQRLRNVLPATFVYVIATQVYLLLIVSSLTALSPGALAVYTYARKVSARVVGLVGRPLSLVFFNHFSHAFASGYASVGGIAAQAMRLSLLLAAIVSAFWASAGLHALRAIWLSDDFSADKVHQAYLVVCLLVMVSVCSQLSIIYRKINVACGRVRSQYLLAALVQLVSAASASILIPAFGLFGAISVIVGNVVLTCFLSGLLVRLCASGAFCIYASRDIRDYAVLVLVGGGLPFAVSHLMESTSMVVQGAGGSAVAALGCVALSGVMLAVSARALRIPEFGRGLRGLTKILTFK